MTQKKIWPATNTKIKYSIEIGAFGGTGELHLLLDRCVGQRARGTCCPPFLLCFENRVNGEWAEGKEVLIWSRTLT